jgi:Domain of unknown function (DUF4252)
MKKLILFAVVLFSSSIGWGQAKATDALQKKHDNALSFYLYKNTLRMLNQSDNKEFDEMVKNIEKIKMLIVDKNDDNFAAADYKKLIKDYQSESYESVMTTRSQGMTFDVFIRDVKGSSLGTVVLASDSARFLVFDMIGTIDVSKVGALFSAIDESADIGKKIRDFMGHKEKEHDTKN